MTWTNLLESLRRAARWHRRLLAAVFAGLAAYCILAAVTEQDDLSSVVVAAHTIPGGRTMTAADLSTIDLPRAAVPEGAFTTFDQAIGQTVVVQLPARAVVTASSVAGGGSLVASGRVALPIGLSESAPVDLLRVGDRIDLLGPGPSGPIEVLVSGTRVVALPEADGGLLGRTSPVVLVDVSREEATRLVAANAPLSFALS